MVFVLIMSNILFGIVIDSFVELYTEDLKLRNNIANVCFICELERDQLEKEGISFDQHISYEHNWEF